MTKCKIGQSLEEFLTQATPDKGLRTLLMCMGEALRTIAFKVRTASCGGTACVNSFGDEQLAVDMLADKLLFEAALRLLCNTRMCVSTLALKNIVDTNFTVGTIFGVWPGDKLTGVTGVDQVAAAMGIYGPRTTYVLAVKGFPGTHEFLLLDEGKWQHVKETTEINEGKMFSPGNLRATFDNSEYSKLIDYYVKEKYTLDTREEWFLTLTRLLLLFEVAPLGLLVENAGGFSSDGYKSVLDKTIVNLDDRTQVAYGSKNEIIRFEETLYGTSRLKNVPIGATA
ncbi:BnaC06g42620D [Brassica napus]|uniref:BnaC06g42620D protein n=1 Tax=Brassica napus TaxID=3708 RepID=A0A078JC10_BRANA|nr:BnaC06g42620D [Brassica napus]